MTPTTLPDEILKTDVMGRVRTPKARRQALLEEFERSGVSGKKFAGLVGVRRKGSLLETRSWQGRKGFAEWMNGPQSAR